MATKVDKKNAIRQGIIEAAIVYSQSLAGKTFLFLLLLYSINQKNQHGSANSNYFQYDKIASCYIYLFLYFLYYSDPVFLRYK